MGRLKTKIAALATILVMAVGLLPASVFAEETFKAYVSVMYDLESTETTANYTGFKVQTEEIPEGAATYGVKVGETDYPYTSKLVGCIYIVDVNGLTANTAYTVQPYYEKDGNKVYGSKTTITTAEAYERVKYSSLTDDYPVPFEATCYKKADSDMAFSFSTNGIDVWGKNSKSEDIGSTFKRQGWYTKFGDDDKSSIGVTKKGVAGGSVDVWQVPSITESGFVKVTYYIRNVSDSQISNYKFGACADTEVAGVDNCSAELTDYGMALSRYEFGQGKKEIFTVITNEGYVERPVSTRWIGTSSSGSYTDYFNYVYDNTSSNEELSQKLRDYEDDFDSAVAYSWQAIRLNSGETRSYSVLYGLGDYETVKQAAENSKIKLTIDFQKESIKGFSNTGYHYITNSAGKKWTLEFGDNGEYALREGDETGTVVSTGLYDPDGGQGVAIQEEWFDSTLTVTDGTAADSETLKVPARPVATEVTDAQVTTTTDSITVTPADGQEYTIDGGESWVAPENGSVIFTGLTQGTDYLVQTYIPATKTAFASKVTAGLTVSVKGNAGTTDEANQGGAAGGDGQGTVIDAVYPNADSGSGSGSATAAGSGSATITSVKTGDESPVALYAVMLLCASAALVLVRKASGKKKA